MIQFIGLFDKQIRICGNAIFDGKPAVVVERNTRNVLRVTKTSYYDGLKEAIIYENRCK